MKREARLPASLPPGLRAFREGRDAARRMAALGRAARRLPEPAAPAIEVPARVAVDAGWMNGLLRDALARLDGRAAA